MKSWKQQRDVIIERRLEFVEAAIAARPTPLDLREAQDKPANQQSLVAVTVASELEDTANPPAVADKPTESAPTGFHPRADTSMRAERDEIIRRVAAFRDLQIKVRQDREQYCDAVLAKTRAALQHRAKAS
jgi:hypothetical protein